MTDTLFQEEISSIRIHRGVVLTFIFFPLRTKIKININQMQVFWALETENPSFPGQFENVSLENIIETFHES